MKIIQFHYVSKDEIYGLGDDGVLYKRIVCPEAKECVWDVFCKRTKKEALDAMRA